MCVLSRAELIQLDYQLWLITHSLRPPKSRTSVAVEYITKQYGADTPEVLAQLAEYFRVLTDGVGV